MYDTLSISMMKIASNSSQNQLLRVPSETSLLHPVVDHLYKDVNYG